MDEDKTTLASAASLETRLETGGSLGASSAASWHPALQTTARSVLAPEVNTLDNLGSITCREEDLGQLEFGAADHRPLGPGPGGEDSQSITYREGDLEQLDPCAADHRTLGAGPRGGISRQYRFMIVKKTCSS